MKSLLLCSLLFAAARLAGAEPPANPPAPYPSRLQWWTDARFGMFIHWGPVSLKGTEIGWSRGAQVPAAEYDQLYQKFNPTAFDAAQWVRIAKDAGMKYIVLTTKHHDGFCLWDTKLTDYNIMRTPFHRDVTKELAEACRQQGLVFCAYHSVCDWWHPDYPLGSPGGGTKKPSPNMDRYNDYLKNEVAELIKNYGPLGILWFDGEWEAPWTVERGQDLYRHCRSLQDSIIVNNRVGKGREGMEGTTAQTKDNPGDYDTPEQTIGRYQDQRPWETCMTICQQWAWKPDDTMKSLEDCLQALIRCAGGDGNLLFNVGPTPEGVIEARQVERLQGMGAWLRQHGATIYGTRGGPWKSTSGLVSTRRGSQVFLHVLKAPRTEIQLPPLPHRITRASFASGERVAFTQSAEGIRLTVPQERLEPVDTIITLDLEGSAMAIPAMSLTPEVTATASNVFEKQDRTYGPQFAFDGDSATRWATDGGTRQAWIAAKYPAARTFSHVRIAEAAPYAGRVQSFEFQCREGESWKTLFSGTKLGERFEKDFPPVTAREFRLNILQSSEGPTLSEIELSKN